jgi:hypothetical protein
MLYWQDKVGLNQGLGSHIVAVDLIKRYLQGTIDILDGSNIGGASHGKIEGSGVGGLGIGTLLQDLRETFLEMFGGTGKHRDRAAKLFDAQLRDIATAGQSC